MVALTMEIREVVVEVTMMAARVKKNREGSCTVWSGVGNCVLIVYIFVQVSIGTTTCV